MATLGNVPAEAYTNTVKDSFSGNGSATAFTMSLPTVTNDVRVVVENVIQDPTVAYSVSGTTLTFTSAPPTGTNNIYVVHLGPAAMTAVPPAEIADATTFASSLTVQGAFTSVGIDDNADATALTITSDEIVLVGASSSNSSNVGHGLNPNGFTYHTRDGGEVLRLNRKSSDGDIATFRKDGTTVGSIGTYVNLPYIGKNDVNLLFDPAGPHVIPRGTNGGARDAAINLGASTNRFKDAYLSGGVYLGGTGSANKLDDFETGHWTPTLPNGGTVGTVHDATYVKVGNLVTVYCNLDVTPTNNSSTFQIGNLPFSQNNNGNHGGGSVSYTGGLDVRHWSGPLVHDSSNKIYFHRHDGSTGVVQNSEWGGSQKQFIVQISYMLG